jgi:hypothetical protein
LLSPPSKVISSTVVSYVSPGLDLAVNFKEDNLTVTLINIDSHDEGLVSFNFGVSIRAEVADRNTRMKGDMGVVGDNVSAFRGASRGEDGSN